MRSYVTVKKIFKHYHFDEICWHWATHVRHHFLAVFYFTFVLLLLFHWRTVSWIWFSSSSHTQTLIFNWMFSIVEQNATVVVSINSIPTTKRNEMKARRCLFSLHLNNKKTGFTLKWYFIKCYRSFFFSLFVCLFIFSSKSRPETSVRYSTYIGAILSFFGISTLNDKNGRHFVSTHAHNIEEESHEKQIKSLIENIFFKKSVWK